MAYFLARYADVWQTSTMGQKMGTVAILTVVSVCPLRIADETDRPPG